MPGTPLQSAVSIRTTHIVYIDRGKGPPVNRRQKPFRTHGRTVFLLRPSRRSGAVAGMQGVTLIETLIAVGMIGVAMSTLAHFMFRAYNNSRMTKRQAQAVLFAQEKMETILAHPGGPDAWEASVKDALEADETTSYYPFDEPGRAAFRWNFTITESEERPALREVHLHTYWRPAYGTGRWPQCELWTLAIQPGAMP